MSRSTTAIALRCYAVLLFLGVPCWGQAARNFGEKSWLEGALRGQIFFLPPQTRRLPDLKSLKPEGTIFARSLNVPGRDWQEGFPGITNRFEWFAIEYTGLIRAPHKGRYTLRLVSDDGSKLWVDEKLIVDNDGEHPATSRSGSVDLDDRQHVIRVQYFQGPRFAVALQLFCKAEGAPEKLFPDCDLALVTDVTRNLQPVSINSPPPVTPGRQQSRIPDQGQVGSPMKITVQVTGNGTPPDRMIAEVEGRKVELKVDKDAGDRVYSGTWTPDTPGPRKIHVVSDGGAEVQPLDVNITVTDKPAPATPPAPPPLARPGELTLGQGVPVTLARLHASETLQVDVRLVGGSVTRDVDIEISTDFVKRHASLQIKTPLGWQTLSTTPLKARLTTADPFHWPLRVQTEKCPEACKPDEVHRITVLAHITDGSIQRSEIPLHLEIIPELWYICWKTELLTALAVLLTGFIAYGFISPYRFGRRAGVQISPAEDPSEGYFFPFRAARGSRAGFYRHARLYVTEDFRIHGKKSGGFVRLRADRDMVRIRPENGRAVYRQQADGSWELLSAQQETIARPGTLYRNDQRTVYFDIRNK